jgi:23S rRNA (adenine2503-C2)-methyltransferase
MPAQQSVPSQHDALALAIDAMARLEPFAHEPRYRAAQVYRWLHRFHAASFSEMTDLPVALRARLAEQLTIPALERVRESSGADGSTKTVYRLADGTLIESVLMRDGAKRTLCVSTQVGCAVGCVFCATGAIGLRRHLSAGEILRQIYETESRLAPEPGGEHLTNVVLMGMGEPLHNYAATRTALERLVGRSGRGMSPRRITLSTSGYPERIARLAREGPHVRLAISLTAAEDELRARLIPLGRRHSVASLVEAGEEYARATGSRVTFEYVMLEGVNDSLDDARLLSRLLRGRRVNLIPLNPHAYSTMRPPSPEAIDRFHRQIKSAGVVSTVRWSRGREIDAACGQLAAQS